LARQLSDDIQAAHVQGDRIRYELFEQPRYDAQENQIVNHLAQYMTEEFLNAGMSVLYDVSTARGAERREMRELAARLKANVLLVWLQIDADSSYARIAKRDRRKLDDKYSPTITADEFKRLAGQMQNPSANEDYVVISGKHAYPTQRNSIVKKLYDAGLLSIDGASNKLVKPGLINLVPNPLAGRVDSTRRNISIR
jgi:predicted kinase